MARFVLARAVTIPHGTPVAAPVPADISFNQYEVEAIEVTIPPGPNGLMGFRIANAGVQVIPYGSNDWIIGNNQVKTWPLQDQITSGDWQVIGYNTGAYDHTIYLEFLVSPVLSGLVDTSGQLIDMTALGGAGGPAQSVLAGAPIAPVAAQPILANPPPLAPFPGGPPPPPPGVG